MSLAVAPDTLNNSRFGPTSGVPAIVQVPPSQCSMRVSVTRACGPGHPATHEPTAQTSVGENAVMPLKMLLSYPLLGVATVVQAPLHAGAASGATCGTCATRAACRLARRDRPGSNRLISVSLGTVRLVDRIGEGWAAGPKATTWAGPIAQSESAPITARTPLAPLCPIPSPQNP